MMKSLGPWSMGAPRPDSALSSAAQAGAAVRPVAVAPWLVGVTPSHMTPFSVLRDLQVQVDARLQAGQQTPFLDGPLDNFRPDRAGRPRGSDWTVASFAMALFQWGQCCTSVRLGPDPAAAAPGQVPAEAPPPMLDLGAFINYFHVVVAEVMDSENRSVMHGVAYDRLIRTRISKELGYGAHFDVFQYMSTLQRDVLADVDAEVSGYRAQRRQGADHPPWAATPHPKGGKGGGGKGGGSRGGGGAQTDSRWAPRDRRSRGKGGGGGYQADEPPATPRRTEPYPAGGRGTPCRYWAEGNCQYGSECTYLHDQRVVTQHGAQRYAAAAKAQGGSGRGAPPAGSWAPAPQAQQQPPQQPQQQRQQPQ